MAKQDEKFLGSLKGKLEENADKIKETAKDVTDKAKEVSADAGKKVKAAGKTAKTVAAKAKEKAETKAEAKAETKTEAPKRTRKTAKTAGVSKNLKSKIVFQFYGNNVDADEVLKKATKAAQKACTDKQIKSLEVYINGHENAAYYVVNGEGKSEYRIDL